MVRSSCQNADVEKQGEGRQQRIFSACLVVLNAKVCIVHMTKIGRKSGMPLFSWWSAEVTAETAYVLEAEIPRSWCQKDSGASGASQVPFSVFRKWSGAFSKQRGGLETAARTIF